MRRLLVLLFLFKKCTSFSLSPPFLRDVRFTSVYLEQKWLTHTLYDALWFHTLWGIVLIYACFECIRRRVWRRPIIALLHASIILIAIGYAFTCYHATTGTLHLLTGVTASHYYPSHHRHYDWCDLGRSILGTVQLLPTIL